MSLAYNILSKKTHSPTVGGQIFANFDFFNEVSAKQGKGIF
jgi:hypothetical protein